MYYYPLGLRHGARFAPAHFTPCARPWSAFPERGRWGRVSRAEPPALRGSPGAPGGLRPAVSGCGQEGAIKTRIASFPGGPSLWGLWSAWQGIRAQLARRFPCERGQRHEPSPPPVLPVCMASRGSGSRLGRFGFCFSRGMQMRVEECWFRAGLGVWSEEQALLSCFLRRSARGGPARYGPGCCSLVLDSGGA